MSDVMLKVDGVSKTYDNGVTALKETNFDVKRGEIFALLGPNGAGKTTLISIICGLANASSGQVLVAGDDINRNYKQTRSKIGLVPQEMSIDGFESVMNSLRFSRALFGVKPDDAYLEGLLKDLALYEKRDEKIIALSGGMKRRVLIGKALSHQPELLFLDEPTAGVDVALRKDLWSLVRRLREGGTTIFLTTHYIEEAEEMADRIGIINKGEILLIEVKAALMKRLGKKKLMIDLDHPCTTLPPSLSNYALDIENDGTRLVYHYDENADTRGIRSLLDAMSKEGMNFVDIATTQSSLEDIFVDIVGDGKERG